MEVIARCNQFLVSNHTPAVRECRNGDEVKVKSNYFIVRPKVDQRAGLLSLPHLGIFAIHTR